MSKNPAINPNHYQMFQVTPKGETLQWIESKQGSGKLKDPELFKAAILLQISKYLDRTGKDDELQEYEKALWYMKFLVAFIKNGNNPILVRDIERLLNMAEPAPLEENDKI